MEKTYTEKKVVHYIGTPMKVDMGFGIREDIRACLVPIDHTNHAEGQEATNNYPCTTSKVVSWDEATGIIETTYSIYKPAVIETDSLASSDFIS